LVTPGDPRNPKTLLSIFGLLLISALLAWGVRAAMLAGILITAMTGGLFGLVSWTPASYSWNEVSATMLRLDLPGALRIGALEIVFVFLFVDLFDNVGTLVGVGKKAGLFTETNEIPRINRILVSDASATVASALAGTSTVVSYIESAAGVAAGG
jgi:AGZA family xanthine/uracil permease-like MFS transporter